MSWFSILIQIAGGGLGLMLLICLICVAAQAFNERQAKKRLKLVHEILIHGQLNGWMCGSAARSRRRLRSLLPQIYSFLNQNISKGADGFPTVILNMVRLDHLACSTRIGFELFTSQDLRKFIDRAGPHIDPQLFLMIRDALYPDRRDSVWMKRWWKPIACNIPVIWNTPASRKEYWKLLRPHLWSVRKYAPRHWRNLAVWAAEKCDLETLADIFYRPQNIPPVLLEKLLINYGKNSDISPLETLKVLKLLQNWEKIAELARGMAGEKLEAVRGVYLNALMDAGQIHLLAKHESTEDAPKSPSTK
jgi:hypothetical protein